MSLRPFWRCATLRYVSIPLPHGQIQVFTPCPPKTNQQPYLSSPLYFIRKRASVTFPGRKKRTGVQVRLRDASALHLGAWVVNVAARGLVLKRVRASAHVRTPDTWQAHRSDQSHFLHPPTLNFGHVIVWSGAFISVLLPVGARKVSFFDAPRSSLIWQKCDPVVTSGEARSHNVHTSSYTSPV